MESIQTLNARLVAFYAKNEQNQPMFRIVWANDQLEKRLINELDSGIHLLYPVVREVKKYAYARDSWVLERMVAVPDFQQKELADVKMSYEPLWVYKNQPTWDAVKVVIDSLYAAMGKKSLRKYVEPTDATSEDGRLARVNKIKEELFGNETEVTDALAYKEAVTVPSNYNSGE